MSDSQTSSQKIRPSRWFHLVALAMITAAVFCGYKIIAVAVNSMQDGLTRAIFPGELVVPISAPGNYVIYYESPSEFGGRIFDTGGRVPGMKFTVINNETEGTLPVAQPSFNETYEMNGRRGRSVLEFRVFKPGSYTVVGRYDDDQANQEAVFAVGNVHIARLALLVIGGIFSILALGGGALLISVLIEARRSSTKRKLRAAAAMPGSIAPPSPL
jgi:hypothetical protein